MNLVTLDFEKYYTPEPNSGCWLWTGEVNREYKGYGRRYLEGRRWQAHILSWMKHKGEVPKGMKVLHRCDVSLCINPEHLFLGTQLDNIKDAIAKKRAVFPKTNYKDNHPNAKLTSEKVCYIRSSPLGNRELAKELGVTHSNISAVRRNKTWVGV